jgi:DNA (cytosine-5)-methyltransferase 1
VSPRIGSLFTGYGGLDRAVQEVLGGQLAWYSENNPAASKVLAHHHPDVPNLGDITTVDWDQVEPVDILTGGFPCQDVSSAGRRAGMSAGTRSGLWAHMATAIDHLRPQLVVIENVRGLTSARADCDLEPCPWCLGDDEDVHLRALGCVLGDLADRGYDAQWCGLRAADVGAPHGRYRVFIVATEAKSKRHGDSWAPLLAWVPAATVAGDQREAAAHAAGPRWGQSGSLASGPAQGAGPEAGRAVGRGGGAPAADTDRAGLEGAEPTAGRDMPAWGPALDWGQFEHAIRHWENVIGRAVPAPTELSDSYLAMVRRRREGRDRRPAGRRGSLRPRRQLSPCFVEWLMGLPEGHVTAVSGLSRNDMLRLLGNGVVPQQAAAALRWLLPLVYEAREAA